MNGFQLVALGLHLKVPLKLVRAQVFLSPFAGGITRFGYDPVAISPILSALILGIARHGATLTVDEILSGALLVERLTPVAEIAMAAIVSVVADQRGGIGVIALAIDDLFHIILHLPSCPPGRVVISVQVAPQWGQAQS